MISLKKYQNSHSNEKETIKYKKQLPEVSLMHGRKLNSSILMGGCSSISNLNLYLYACV